MTSTFTSDFRDEFEQERERWLRRRLLWYLGVTIGFSVLSIIVSGIGYVLALQTRQHPSVSAAVGIALLLTITTGAMYVWAFFHARRRLLSRDQTVRLFVWLFVVSGALGLLSSVAGYETSRRSLPAVAQQPAEVVDDEQMLVESDEPEATATAPDPAPDAAADQPADAGERPRVRIQQASKRALTFQGLANMLIGHFIACLFLPLTPRESFRPLYPLIALNALISVVYFPGWVLFFLALALSGFVGMPGAAVCWWRFGRFSNRFQLGALKRRYSEMKQELTDARRIHEALFPAPLVEGAVRMDFRYEPMRQIGGDYLYARYAPSPHGEQPALNVVIVDVTGHGIPAALTVNRLHGELERLFAEDPAASPGRILNALNRYVHLTLASHSVYVTAICFRVDPNAPADGAARGSRGVLQWASGGHPPAFVRSIDGRIERLDSTTFVLGACHGDDFQHGMLAMPFGPGDLLIAYTDGATEARDKAGRMLRIEGLQRIIAAIAPAPGRSAAEFVLRGVDAFRFGPPADDTLVVEISRPIGG